MFPFEKPAIGGALTLMFGTAVQALPGLNIRQPAALASTRQPSGAATLSTRVTISWSGGATLRVLDAPSPLSLSAIRAISAPSSVENTKTGFLPACCLALSEALISASSSFAFDHSTVLGVTVPLQVADQLSLVMAKPLGSVVLSRHWT